ncbi:fas-binding factor 1 homolog isoform X2 [Cynoglossus semilaevis]|uniref:fas-binding factor 1 homolog isoform X2 n=1 Tax=Cynoglossus semilaevis TaxID=244447 RepID=UPI000D62A711|nr:fas-binding factor 1 homolog isoform X2 [Cynoglossus semilaevis]
MATRTRGKLSKRSFGDDDILDSLFEDKKKPSTGRAARSGPLNRSSATDNIYSLLAEEAKTDDGNTENSDVSAADPNDILKDMKDIDDMDADLFTLKKKPNSAPAQTKPFGKNIPKATEITTSDNNAKHEGAGEQGTNAGRKPHSAPSVSTRSHRRFSFSDLDDPLADLDDLLPDETRLKSKSSVQQPKSKPETVSPPSASPVLKAKKTKAAASDLFDDDQDDLMEALGFGSDKNDSKKKDSLLWPNKERKEPPQRARTRLDDILESRTSPRLLERPPTGERKDTVQSQEKQQQQEKSSSFKEPPLDDDLTFGSYQPTLGSTPEGRQSRRQSVRFSTEDISPSTQEKDPKTTTTAPPRQRTSADWLGLKTDDENVLIGNGNKEIKTSSESPRTSSSPLMERKSSLTGGQATPSAPANQSKREAPVIQKKEEEEEGEEEEEDWLAGALGRKKALASSSNEAKKLKPEDSSGLGGEPEQEPFISKQGSSQAPRVQEAAPAAVKETSNTANTGLPLPNEALDDTRTQLKPLSLMSAPLSGTFESFPQQNQQMHNSAAAVQQQGTFSADNLQQVLLQQQMIQSQLLGLGGVVNSGVLQSLKYKDIPPGDYQGLQVRIIQLEGQVKTLQLERDQSQMMLLSVQQQHKQEIELIENTHKARIKLLEESAVQRETRCRQENEDLMERLATVTRSAEQERSELQAQYQRKLAQAQQERDREVERLRDFQRKSIAEMKKDHEDQINRLKKLKAEEIDAVTSATSQTRSLTVVIEQMEQFSSRLGELSSRVESTHENTAHGLEQGARHRDEQLRIMQERLAQQQKTMAEERTYLKEIISRMDAQLNEQQRQLEKERWKITAEQAKAESTQRGLEEERRSLSMQINMEREELERAKSALLEEQKSVMQHCADERRKLAAEWADFRTQEKQRHQRSEREVGSLLEKREGSIISLAQEQADLKLRTADLKQKEMTLVQERETLERLREELDREKERISSTALRLQTRAQEVEAFSNLAAEKYEEGERALKKAKHVEAEHESRLRNIHLQTDQLRQQEKRILQERRQLNHLQEAGRLRQDITSTPHIIHPVLPDPVPTNPELTSTLNIQPPTSLTNTQSMTLQASLALWKYTAEKERQYLQEEQIFLESLKKKSYRSSSHTDQPLRAGQFH